MSELPQGWAKAIGDDLFSSVRGVTYSKSDASSVSGNGSVPILRANNIVGGSIVADDLVFVPAKCVSPDQNLRDGDLLIASSSGSRTVVGKAAPAGDGDHIYAFGAFCTIARPRTGDFGKWLSAYSRSRAYRDYVEQVALGININNLRGSDLKAIPIPVAPIPEQRRIVAKIDSLTGKSRRARDHLDHIPRLVEKYKQAVLEAAFAGDLYSTSESRSNSVSVSKSLRELTLRHRKLKTILDGAVVESLFELPANWCWTNAETVVEPGAEIVYGIVQPGPKLTYGVPYVRGTDIEGGRIKLEQLLFTSPEIAKRYERASLRGGDILLGIIRATKVAIVPDELTGGNITQGTARFRPSDIINTDFLARWLESQRAQRWLHSKYRGIDMPGLNLRDVRQLPVPLPPLDEQRSIVAGIERAFTWIERLAADATSARKLVDYLDQAVLGKAFKGELVPQDPSDEPASILLDRVRTERAAAPKAKRGRKTAA